MHIQRIKTPDGNEMVVLSAADYDALVGAKEDAIDRAAVREALASIDTDGTEPLNVLKAKLAGVHPIRAWLEYRGKSQADLSRMTGLSPVWINRMITTGKVGSRLTRAKIAAALNAPVWSLSAKDGD